MKTKISMLLAIVFLLSACGTQAAPTSAGTQPPLLTNTPASVARPEISPTSTLEPLADPTPDASPNASPDPEPAVTSQSGEAEVEIEDFAFNPGTLTVKAGTTIKFSNKDDTPHKIVGDDGSWGSGSLNKGDDFNLTFTQAGTYTYHCGFHASMKGTIVVVAQ
jgi:plastocyanin